MENNPNAKKFLCPKLTAFLFLFIYLIEFFQIMLGLYGENTFVMSFISPLIIYLIINILINTGIDKNNYKVYRYGLTLSITYTSFKTVIYIGLSIFLNTYVIKIIKNNILLLINDIFLLIIDWILAIILIIYNKKVKEEIELDTSELLNNNENEPLENNNNEENNSPEP